MDKNTRKGKRLLFLMVFFILLAASILSGFILVKNTNTFKEKKDLAKLPQPKEIPVVEMQNSPEPSDRSVELLPLNNNTTDIRETNNRTGDIETGYNKTLEMERVYNKTADMETVYNKTLDGEKVYNKTADIKKEKTKREKRKSKPSVEGRKKVKTNLKDQKLTSSQRRLYKASKKPKPKKEINIPLKGTSDEKTPLLKEKKLMENLLLNAEEARVKGNIEEAINFYTAYLKYKEDPDVLNNLAGLYILRGEFNRAEKLLKRALSIKYDVIYEINLVITLWKQGEKDKACQYLKEREFPSHLRYPLEELNNFCINRDI